MSTTLYHNIVTATRIDSNELCRLVDGVYYVHCAIPHIFDVGTLCIFYYADKSSPFGVTNMGKYALVYGKGVWIWVSDGGSNVHTVIGASADRIPESALAHGGQFHAANILHVEYTDTECIVDCCVRGVFVRVRIWEA